MHGRGAGRAFGRRGQLGGEVGVEVNQQGRVWQGRAWKTLKAAAWWVSSQACAVPRSLL